MIAFVLPDEQQPNGRVTQLLDRPPSYRNHHDEPTAGFPRLVSAMTPQEEFLLGQEYYNKLMALCAQGKHEVNRRHGVAGIICAVLLFPLGLICLAVDSKRYCSRCGVRIH